MASVTASAHVVVRADKLILPAPNGDRDTEIDFFVSYDLEPSGSSRRPYLLYRINPQDDEAVHLVIRINGELVVDQVLRDPAAQSFHAVFENDALHVGENTIVIRIPDDQPGAVAISDIVVVHSIEFLMPSNTSSQDAPPTGGPL